MAAAPAAAAGGCAFGITPQPKWRSLIQVWPLNGSPGGGVGAVGRACHSGSSTNGAAAAAATPETPAAACLSTAPARSQPPPALPAAAAGGRNVSILLAGEKRGSSLLLVRRRPPLLLQFFPPKGLSSLVVEQLSVAGRRGMATRWLGRGVVRRRGSM